MGEQPLSACVIEQLTLIVSSISYKTTFEDWYWDGCSIAEVIGADAEKLHCEQVALAWGYLRGVADALDLTVYEMLSSFDDDNIRTLITLRTTPVTRKARHAARHR